MLLGLAAKWVFEFEFDLEGDDDLSEETVQREECKAMALAAVNMMDGV